MPQERDLGKSKALLAVPMEGKESIRDDREERCKEAAHGVKALVSELPFGGAIMARGENSTDAARIAFGEGDRNSNSSTPTFSRTFLVRSSCSSSALKISRASGRIKSYPRFKYRSKLIVINSVRKNASKKN
jgi:hypothetical protein